VLELFFQRKCVFAFFFVEKIKPVSVFDILFFLISIFLARESESKRVLSEGSGIRSGVLESGLDENIWRPRRFETT